MEVLQEELKLRRDVSIIDILARDKDIDLLIRQKIDFAPEFRRLLGGEPTLKVEISRRIKEKASGMFLHASLQIEALRYSTSHSKLLQKLDEFPKGIKASYQKTLELIESQHEERPEFAKKILLWLLNAQRPISVQAIGEALATCTESHTFDESGVIPADICVSICRGLVVMDSMRVLRLIHDTANEVLPALLSPFCPFPHTLLSATCISHILSPINIHGHHLAPSGHGSFLQYAHGHLATHLRTALALPNPTSDQMILYFLLNSPPLHADILVQMPDYSQRTFFCEPLSPVHVVAFLGLPSRILSAIVNASNINARTSDQKLTPLMVAALQGHSDAVVTLLNTPCIDINLVDNEGFTALMWATRQGRETVVRILLACKGIDVNVTDHYGRLSALMHALYHYSDPAEENDQRMMSFRETRVCDYGKSSDVGLRTRPPPSIVAQLLAVEHIDVRHVDRDGRTALMWAAIRGNDTDVPRLLELERGTGDLRDTKDGRTALMHAIINRQSVAAMELILNGVRLGCVDNEKKTALIWAVLKEDEAVVRRMIERSEDCKVALVDGNGKSALDYAIRCNDPGIALLLSSCPGAAVNHPHFNSAAVDQGEEEEGPSISAAVRGHLDVVRQLVTLEGFDPNATDVKGKTALLHAMGAGHLDIVLLLVGSRGVDLCSVDEEGRNVVIWATIHGHEDVLQKIVEVEKSPAPFNIVDGQGKSALIHAIWNGRTSLVLLLLNSGLLDLGHKDPEGWTPLIWAAIRGNDEVAARVLEHVGEDVVNSRDKVGRTALIYAIWKGHTSIALRLLQSPTIDIRATDEEGRSALTWATINGNEDLVQRILGRGEEGIVNGTDENGTTALVHAILHGHTGIALALLEFPGIKVSNVDAQGVSPQMWAAMRGNEVVTRRLLDVDSSSLNFVDKDGRTALIHAIRRAYPAIAMHLLSPPGVELNHADKEGRTALIWASKIPGCEEVFSRLWELEDDRDDSQLFPS